MQAAAATTLATTSEAATVMPLPRFEGKDTPKICLEAALTPYATAASASVDEAAAASARRIRQLGVEYAISGMAMPWTVDSLNTFMGRYKAHGVTVANIMIGGFNKAIYAKPGRDEEIEQVMKSVQAAGKVGLPVVEYNWYAHRAMEGYFEEPGRAGSGWTGFDYQRPSESNGKMVPFKDLPALDREGAHTLDEMWANITYFLKAVVPAAEKAGVRLADRKSVV